jgi:hypothetical protein
MAENISISYSFQTGIGKPSATPPAAELIAFTSCELIDLGSGGTMLLSRDNGKQMIVTPEVAMALTYCTTFRTLQEHAHTLTETVPQLRGQVADVTKVLNMVNDAGLMLEAKTVCNRLNKKSEAAIPLPATRIFIITCDRPAAVQRLLDSMLQSTKLSIHDELVLVDDSRNPLNGEKNREAVAQFNLTSSKNMRYVGAEMQQHLLQQLVEALPEHASAIRFLIDRERWATFKSYGLARTVCLLLSTGYRCIVLDDDVLCQSVKPPSLSHGLSFGGGSNRELACFASEQELLQNAVYNDTDPLAGHASCLGMPLGQAIQQLTPDDIDQTFLRDSNAAMLNTLRETSPVLITQCGSWGDPGTQGSNWLTQLDKESLRGMLVKHGGLQGALNKRHYWLGRKCPNISKMAVMSQATGLDNSKLLPPYFPILRGEDYLFASMALFVHPDAAVVDYNWSVPHLPIDQREHAGSGGLMAAQPGVGLLARYIADRTDYDSGLNPTIRLEQLALILRELGECRQERLMTTARTELAVERASQLRQLGDMLQTTADLNSPEWAAFLQQGMERISGAQQQPAKLTDSTPEEITEDTILLRTQAVLTEFSGAVTAWPKIRDAATGIAKQIFSSDYAAP